MRGYRLVHTVTLAICVSACRTVAPSRSSADAGTRVAPNDNRVSAGVLRDGVLTLRLELREARWYPEGSDGPSEMIQVFAEEGRAPQNPGPLIRVPAGTRIQVSIRNPLLDSTLVIYGLHTRPGSLADTIQVAPGATREVAFSAGEPGTYYYAGSTSGAPPFGRYGKDSQLHGAFIIDPPGRTPPRDRIFVLGLWGAFPDSGAPPNAMMRHMRVINGLSWPHTERLAYTVGDTVRWRWVNPTLSDHPMHLHGFYFSVRSRGTWAADTLYAPDEMRGAVTENTPPGGTFAMEWVPEEPGNWLMHCHFSFHLSHFLSLTQLTRPPDPIAPHVTDHSVHGMRGMILGVTVDPGKSTARRPAQVAGARQLRLVAQSAPKGYLGSLDGMAYVLQEEDREPAPDSVPVPSSMLVLKRGEPVRITVVNRLRAPNSVHWHGIELPSYNDGVPGWSGHGKQLAPTISPGDSFVVHFTPPRAGTFMYHSHSNELFQINLGLYGALLVVDPDQYDPARERVFVVGGNGPGGYGYGTRPAGETPIRVNGQPRPDTVRMTAGETYRLRIVQITSDAPLSITLRQGDRTLAWRPIAKDGADLPPGQRVVGPATLFATSGEAADFEFTPSAPGLLTLEFRVPFDKWMLPVPILVESSGAPGGG